MLRIHSKKKNLFSNDEGVSVLIGFMFIIVSIILYASIAYPAMIKSDIKNSELNAIVDLDSKMLKFSDDIQSDRKGQDTFQLTASQKYSTSSAASMLFSPNSGAIDITTTHNNLRLSSATGILSIKTKNIYAEDRTIAFQAGVVIEQQVTNSWSNTASFFFITGKNVSAQIPIIIGTEFSIGGGIETLKYNSTGTPMEIHDTDTAATITIDTPYPQVFENIFENDMKGAGLISPKDYTLSSTANSVSLSLNDIDSIDIDIIPWMVNN